MQELTDDGPWYSPGEHGVFGPEATLSESSIGCDWVVGDSIGSDLARDLAAWVHEEGRASIPDPRAPQPTGKMRARLAALRRRFKRVGISIRRERGRRWWFAYFTPKPDIGGALWAILDSARETSQGFLPIGGYSDSDLLPRAEDSLARALAGRKRVTRNVALAAIIVALRESVDDRIPF